MFSDIAALLLVGLSGCAPAEPAGPPDLVLITLDTTRADHLGAWGYGAADTPWLDGFARLGLRFTQATTVSNNTLPAHVSMMTGQHAHTAGVPRNGHKLGAAAPWLPEILRQHGYETAAFVSASALSGELGLSRGFDIYDDYFDVKEMDQRQRRADTTARAAAAWLDQPHDKPLFLWVHLFDPHYPYTPPPPHDRSHFGYRGLADGSMEYLLGVWGRMGHEKVPTTEADRQRLVELYDGELAWLDSQVGPLLQKVQGRDAFVAVVADHGESLTEHDDLFDHGEFLYQPSLHVPLVLRAPATWTSPAGTSDALAQTIDIMPTFLAAAGVGVPSGVEGQDLLPLVRSGGPGGVRETAFAESCRPWEIEKRYPGDYQNLHKAQSALRWPHKLIVTPFQGRVELYDLSRDPQELVDVASEHPDVVEALSREIEGWRGGRLTLGRPDAENMEQIKALGYSE